MFSVTERDALDVQVSHLLSNLLCLFSPSVPVLLSLRVLSCHLLLSFPIISGHLHLQGLHIVTHALYILQKKKEKKQYDSLCTCLCVRWIDGALQFYLVVLFCPRRVHTSNTKSHNSCRIIPFFCVKLASSEEDVTISKIHFNEGS